MTISSTSNSESPAARRVRCGLDTESVQRFRRFVEAAVQLSRPAGPGVADGPDSLIFHPAELSAALASPDPCRWLCRCFCAKEALFKALGSPFNYNQLEFLPEASPVDWLWHGESAGLAIPPAWPHFVEMNDSEREIWVSVVFYAPDVASWWT